MKIKNDQLNETICECKNITKIIKKRTLLNNVNMSIKKNKLNVLLGQNETGKSTLLFRW